MAQDEAAMVNFIQKKLRYARAMRTLNKSNSNWHGVMVLIWTHMDLGIKQFLPPPETDDTLAGYMSKVAKAKPILLAAAREKFGREKSSDSQKKNRQDWKSRGESSKRRERPKHDTDKSGDDSDVLSWKRKGNDKKFSCDRRRDQYGEYKKQRDYAKLA
ncbi:hypothetical protein EV127DRAFT_117939 [Xylaria flabelliformis]|nr:hypothetical protein EV127DRAFT_117939 [Xylaria flabelliformis]